MRSTPGANVINLFTAVSYDFYNKLERLSLGSLSRLMLCLRASSGAYPRVEQLQGASLGLAHAFPASIRPG
jgi:hypothetical protein